MNPLRKIAPAILALSFALPAARDCAAQNQGEMAISPAQSEHHRKVLIDARRLGVTWTGSDDTFEFSNNSPTKQILINAGVVYARGEEKWFVGRSPFFIIPPRGLYKVRYVRPEGVPDDADVFIDLQKVTDDGLAIGGKPSPLSDEPGEPDKIFPRNYILIHDLSGRWRASSGEVINVLQDGRHFVVKIISGAPEDDRGDLNLSFRNQNSAQYTYSSVTGPAGRAKGTISPDANLIEWDNAIVWQRENRSLDEFRTFTSTEGREIRGKFLSLKGDSVEIENENGKAYTFPITRLSEADQGFVRKADSVQRRIAGAPSAPVTIMPKEDVNRFHELSKKYKDAERELKFTEAIRYAKECLEVVETALGPDHRDVGEIASDLTRLYSRSSSITLPTSRAAIAEIESFHRRALAISEKTRGADHEITIARTIDLAEFCQRRGNYEEAEALFERALATLENTVGPGEAATAQCAITFANFAKAAGSYTRAEKLFRQAIAISEARNRPGDSITLGRLIGFAKFSRDIGKLEQAADMFRRAMESREQTLGADHLDTARTRDLLADVHMELGRDEEALRLYQQALSTFEKEAGLNPRSIAPTIRKMAQISRRRGNFEEAEALYRSALAYVEPPGSLVGINADGIAGELMTLLTLLNRREEAVSLVPRFISAQQKILGQTLSSTTEQERLIYHRDQNPVAYIASLSLAKETAELVLRTKGIVIESLMEDRWLMQQADRTPENRALYRRLRESKAALRRSVLEGSHGADDEAEIEAIEDEVRMIEKAFAKLAKGARNGSRDAFKVTVEQVASALPGDFALVEYFPFFHYGRDSLNKPLEETHYGAVVIRKDAEPALLDCGPRSEIDSQIALFIKAATGKADEETLRTASQLLFTLLVKPLEPHLSSIDTLVLSPEGQVNFIPFAALLDGQSRFLSETRSIYYVGSGRDILTGPGSLPPSKNRMVLFGGPAFRIGESDPQSEGEFAVESLEDTVRAGLRNDAGNIELQPLPGAAREAQVVIKAFGLNPGDAITFKGEDATESRFRESVSPRALHLATHGFFLKEIAVGADAANPTTASHLVQNPMYRSGIALAGAQSTFDQWKEGTVPHPNNDGILMAAEVGDLDLRGTSLVTLSACGTATGEISDGEGVMGLRRGFVMAGAQNVLMTLWPVPDEETVDFMQNFYSRYAKTNNAPKALADVQREWLVRLRDEKSLLEAVSLAGAFVMSAQATSN